MHSTKQFWSESQGGRVLVLDGYVESQKRIRIVFDIVQEKQTSARPMDEEAGITTTDDPPEEHPIIYQSLTEIQIPRAVLRTQGSAGLSGMSAAGFGRKLKRPL